MASLSRASFSHRCVIDCGMDGIIYDVYSIPFSARARNLQNRLKTKFYNELTCYYLSEKWLLIVVMICSIPVWALTFDDLLRQFGLHVGTLLVWFSMLPRDRFFDIWGDSICVDQTRFLIRKCTNALKSVHRGSSRIRPPSPTFLPTCESYMSETHKFDLKGFPNVKVSLKVFLHTCEPCRSETYKCAVTRKKNNYRREAMDSESSKAQIWEHVLFICAPVWITFVVTASVAVSESILHSFRQHFA